MITGKRIVHKNNLLLDFLLGYLYICSRQQMFDSVVSDSSKRTYVHLAKTSCSDFWNYSVTFSLFVQTTETHKIETNNNVCCSKSIIYPTLIFIYIKIFYV